MAMTGWQAVGWALWVLLMLIPVAVGIAFTLTLMAGH